MKSYFESLIEKKADETKGMADRIWAKTKQSSDLGEWTPETLRVAIAEARGWTRHKIEKSSDGIDIYESVWLPKDHKPPLTNTEIQEHCRISLPDYPSDLNAIHEAEKVLTEWQDRQYRTLLQEMTAVQEHRATALQRSLAVARTLNLKPKL